MLRSVASRQFCTAARRVPDGTITMLPRFKLKDPSLKPRAIEVANKRVGASAAAFFHLAWAEDGEGVVRLGYQAVADYLAELEASKEAKESFADLCDMLSVEIHAPGKDLQPMAEAVPWPRDNIRLFETDAECVRSDYPTVSSVSLAPYFEVPDVGAFRRGSGDYYEVAKGDRLHHYGFAYDTAGSPAVVLCRECYPDACALQRHLEGVGSLLKKTLETNKLKKLELYGPRSELEKVRPALAPLGARFFFTG